MHAIIGRKKERRKLDKIMASKKSEFVTLYGRRRVGKTFLIREYFQYKFDFQLTGLARASTRQQLFNFHATFQRQVPNSPLSQPPQNWLEAFQILMDHLESIKGKRKKVIFLDELPWLDTARSDFLMALEHFWNSWASNRKDIILISCGSAASWMINTLINNKGGLHNRVTVRMKIHPFTLSETEQYLKSKNIVLDRYQIIHLYMAMGGIPYYLDNISKGKSAWQTVEEMCFRKGALLATEFPNLLNSLFKNASNHEKIVTTLASKTSGMTRKSISATAKIPTGGSLTKLLEELEESGFITSYTPFQKKSRNTIYRLSDFYSMFYLRFLKHNNKYDPGTWVNGVDSPAHRAWAGYTFEQVCLAHIPQIKKALGISGIVSNTSSWISKGPQKGAQVDLLIDRRDQTINLCEIKYATNPYPITKAYATKLRNKIGVFKHETQTRKSVFLTMITTFGLLPNQYVGSLVQNEITMDALFEF